MALHVHLAGESGVEKEHGLEAALKVICKDMHILLELKKCLRVLRRCNAILRHQAGQMSRGTCTISMRAIRRNREVR
jgi:hypothetical protein